MMQRIMIVDDDIPIGDMLEEVLEKEGYQVSRAYSGTEALLLLDARRPDLVLLDLMLPGLSGEEVLPPDDGGFPSLSVSAKGDVDGKVGLLAWRRGGLCDQTLRRQGAAGADRRRPAAGGGPGGRGADRRRSAAGHGGAQRDGGGQAVRLTRTEFAVLKLLMQNPSQVLAKSVLLDRIAADTPDCTESSLKMHVSHLRRKLREAGGKEYIEAVWGIGFRLAAE